MCGQIADRSSSRILWPPAFASHRMNRRRIQIDKNITLWRSVEHRVQPLETANAELDNPDYRPTAISPLLLVWTSSYMCAWDANRRGEICSFLVPFSPSRVAVSLIRRNALNVMIFCMTELMRQSPALKVGCSSGLIGTNMIVPMHRMSPMVVLSETSLKRWYWSFPCCVFDKIRTSSKFVQNVKEFWRSDEDYRRGPMPQSMNFHCRMFQWYP